MFTPLELPPNSADGIVHFYEITGVIVKKCLSGLRGYFSCMNIKVCLIT